MGIDGYLARGNNQGKRKQRKSYKGGRDGLLSELDEFGSNVRSLFIEESLRNLC